MLLKHKDEIQAFLTKAPALELGVIWQTIGIRRDIYKIKSVDVLSDRIIFMTSATFEIDIDHPVYINVNYKNFIFKLNKGDYKSSRNQLVCDYPSEAKAIESRKYARTKIPKRASITLTLKAVNSDTAIEAKITLVDVSELGIGGSFNVINTEFFQRNNIFQVVKICEKDVVEDSLIHVRFLKVDNKSGRVSIGFSLTKPFSSKFHEVLFLKMKENLAI